MAIVVGDIVANFTANIEKMFKKMDDLQDRLTQLSAKPLKIQLDTSELSSSVKGIESGVKALNKNIDVFKRGVHKTITETSKSITGGFNDVKNRVLTGAETAGQQLKGQAETILGKIAEFTINTGRTITKTFIGIGSAVAFIGSAVIPGFVEAVTKVTGESTEAAADAVSSATQAATSTIEASGATVRSVAVSLFSFVGDTLASGFSLITSGLSFLVVQTGQLFSQWVANASTALSLTLGLGDATLTWAQRLSAFVTLSLSITGFVGALNLGLTLFRRFLSFRPNSVLGRFAAIINSMFLGIFNIIPPFTLFVQKLASFVSLSAAAAVGISVLSTGINTAVTGFLGFSSVVAGVIPVLQLMTSLFRIAFVKIGAALGSGRAQFILFLANVRQSFAVIGQLTQSLKNLPKQFNIVKAIAFAASVLVSIRDRLVDIVTILASVTATTGKAVIDAFQMEEILGRVKETIITSKESMTDAFGAFSSQLKLAKKDISGLNSLFIRTFTQPFAAVVNTLSLTGALITSVVKTTIISPTVNALRVTFFGFIESISEKWRERWKTAFGWLGTFGKLAGKVVLTGLSAIFRKRKDFQEDARKMWAPEAAKRAESNIKKLLDKQRELKKGVEDTNKRFDEAATRIKQQIEAAKGRVDQEVKYRNQLKANISDSRRGLEDIAKRWTVIQSSQNTTNKQLREQITRVDELNKQWAKRASTIEANKARLKSLNAEEAARLKRSITSQENLLKGVTKERDIEVENLKVMRQIDAENKKIAADLSKEEKMHQSIIQDNLRRLDISQKENELGTLERRATKEQRKLEQELVNLEIKRRKEMGAVAGEQRILNVRMQEEAKRRITLDKEGTKIIRDGIHKIDAEVNSVINKVRENLNKKPGVALQRLDSRIKQMIKTTEVKAEAAVQKISKKIETELTAATSRGSEAMLRNFLRTARGTSFFGAPGGKLTPAFAQVISEGDVRKFIDMLTKTEGKAQKIFARGKQSFQGLMADLNKIARQSGNENIKVLTSGLSSFKGAIDDSAAKFKEMVRIMAEESPKAKTGIKRLISSQTEIRTFFAKIAGASLRGENVDRMVKTFINRTIASIKDPSLRRKVSSELTHMVEKVMDESVLPFMPSSDAKHPKGLRPLTWGKKFGKGLAQALDKEKGTIAKSATGMVDMIANGFKNGLSRVKNAFGFLLKKGVKDQIPSSPPLSGPLAGNFLSDSGSKIIGLLSFGIARQGGFLNRVVGGVLTAAFMPLLGPGGLLIKGVKLAIDGLSRLPDILMRIVQNRIVSGLVSVGESIREISHAAERVGVDIEKFDTFAQGVRTLGVESSQLETIFLTLTRRLAEAASGNVEAARQFERFGIDLQAVRSGAVDAVDVFLQLSTSIDSFAQQFGENSQIVQEGLDLSGAAFGRLRTLVLRGGDEIRRMMQQMRRTGVILDDESVETAEAFNIKIIELKNAIEGIRRELAETLFPLVTRLTTNLLDWWARFKEPVIDGLSAIIEMVLVLGEMVATKIGEWTTDRNAFVRDLSILIGRLFEFFLRTSEVFMRNALPVIRTVFAFIWESAQPILDRIIDYIRNTVLPRISNLVTNTVSNLFSITGTGGLFMFIRAFFEAIRRIASGIIEFIVSIGDTAQDILVDLGLLERHETRAFEVAEQRREEARAAQRAQWEAQREQTEQQLERARRMIDVLRAQGQQVSEAEESLLVAPLQTRTDYLETLLELQDRVVSPGAFGGMADEAVRNRRVFEGLQQAIERVPSATEVFDRLQQQLEAVGAQAEDSTGRINETFDAMVEAARASVEDLTVEMGDFFRSFADDLGIDPELQGRFTEQWERLNAAIVRITSDTAEEVERVNTDLGDSQEEIMRQLEVAQQHLTETFDRQLNQTRQTLVDLQVSLAEQAAESETFIDRILGRSSNLIELQTEQLMLQMQQQLIEAKEMYESLRVTLDAAIDDTVRLIQITDRASAEFQRLLQRRDALLAERGGLAESQAETERAIRDSFERQIEELPRRAFKPLAENVASAITEGIKDAINRAFDPETGQIDFGRMIGGIMRDISDSMIDDMLNDLTGRMTTALTSMFESVFSFAGDLAGDLANAVMLITSLLLRSAEEEVNVVKEGIQDVVESTEQVRGVISGETTVKLKEVSDNLREALEPTNDILRQILGAVQAGRGIPSPGGFQAAAAGVGSI